MIYFDACATGGKKEQCVINACVSHFENIANAGRSGHKLAVENGIAISEFRSTIAGSFSLFSPQKVVLTKNCSEALNIGILGIISGLKKTAQKPHVITTALEHNSVLRPLFHLKSKGDIELSILPPLDFGGVSWDQVRKSIRKNTKLVCINLVSNVTGGRSEVEDIASHLAKTDILTLCDGAQGLGHFEFSAENIDILCAPMHKALGGVMGVGFAGFSKRANPVPIAFGGTGVNSNSLSQGTTFPESFEVGTLNLPGILASHAGLTHKMTHLSESKKKVAQLYSHLKSYKFENLKEFSVTNECGIFSFLIGNIDSSEIANILNEKYDIACRGGLTCAPLIHRHLGTSKSGVCRVSFDEYNTHEEIEILANALKEIAENY